MSWLREASDVAVPSVAVALGYSIEKRAGVHGIRPCPSCGAEKTSGGDRRPPIGLTLGWKCHACSMSGNGIGLVCLRLFGSILPAGDPRWPDVRSWFAAQGWCSASGREGGPPPVRPSPPPPIAAAPPRVQIPEGEVGSFWTGCGSLVDSLLDPTSRGVEAAAFLRARGYARYAYEIREDDLARITPDPMDARDSFPAWWPLGRARTWRLVTRGWTADGRAANLHGRAIGTPPTATDRDTGKEHDLPKTLWAKGADSTRLLFADREGLALLRGEAHPDLFAVVICEGITDWLSASAWLARKQQSHARRGAATGESVARIAVLGAASGGFPALADIRWPDRPLDVVATVDEDDAGDAYLLQIVEAMGARPVRRLSVSALVGGA